MGASSWDDTPATADGNDGTWKPDMSLAKSKSVQSDQAQGGDVVFEISKENTSKHADGPHDGGCRICGEDGHFARDCPDKPEGGAGGLSGACFNCGEVGHNKADCTNPRVEREFTGECRLCNQVGHRAADCPTKPPSLCSVCHGEGHTAASCTVNRMIAEMHDMGIQDISAEDAWVMLEAADKDKDLDDIKKGIYTYAKAYPELTYQELESVLRETGMNTHLIAKQQEIAETQTIINLQGKPGQEYVVSFQYSAKPRRAKMAEGWPSSPEENITRLETAGRVVNSMIPRCNNCDQMGHVTRACPEERVERGGVVISCANCNEEGHRARDCTQPRKSGRKECKNCGGEGHFAKDCPDREPEICHNCQQEGHRAKDCDNERVMKCRNCDELGHASRECSKPTDWSRVECSNCKEKGHSYKRCPLPPVVVEADEDGGDGVAATGGW